MRQGSNVVPLFQGEAVEIQKPADEVQAIFDRYRQISGHTRAVLDQARKRVIRARLTDGFTPEDLELAFYGCTFSSFHQGDNERQTKYDSITLILRDADQVEKFRAIAEHVIARMKARAERQQQAQSDAPAFDPESQRANLVKFLEQAKSLGVKVKK